MNEQPTPQYAQVVVTARSGWPSATIDFSMSAPVGQDSTQAPQETHSESMNGWSWLADTFESKPRPWMVSAKRALHLVAGAHAARADDAQLRVEGEVGIADVLRHGRAASLPGALARSRVMPDLGRMSCSSQCSFAGQSSHSSG